jgi:integrase
MAKAAGDRKRPTSPVCPEESVQAGFRALRRPHVPHKLIAPFSTGELERLLALADPRERALTLLLLDTGLRLAEGRIAAGRRPATLRDREVH